MQMRRFINLVDAFYEGSVKLVVLAEDEPLKLLQITPEEKLNCPFDEVLSLYKCICYRVSTYSASASANFMIRCSY
jgi:predicted ATPase